MRQDQGPPRPASYQAGKNDCLAGAGGQHQQGTAHALAEASINGLQAFALVGA